MGPLIAGICVGVVVLARSSNWDQTGTEDLRQALILYRALVFVITDAKLAQSFSDQRNNLEDQWGASNEVSTEELRVVLTRHRSFFERLLSV